MRYSRLANLYHAKAHHRGLFLSSLLFILFGFSFEPFVFKLLKSYKFDLKVGLCIFRTFSYEWFRLPLRFFFLFFGVYICHCLKVRNLGKPVELAGQYYKDGADEVCILYFWISFLLSNHIINRYIFDRLVF